MRILIAGGAGPGRRALRAQLEGWEYEVVEADNGGEAIAALSAPLPPTVAVVDVDAPVVNGLAVCRQIRKRPHGPYVYLVLLTSRAGAAPRIEALEAGADDCIALPYDPLELRGRLLAGRRIVELQEELVAAHEATRVLASRDSLTSLLTRGAILDALERELARSRRQREPLAVVLVDLDHFKRVNDVHGHPAGDAVLSEAARRMAAVVRPYDLLGRYGGEEFLLALPGCDATRAMVVAERIRAAVGGTAYHWEGKDLTLTASLGVAESSGGGTEGFGRLIAAADTALYRAKAEGRDRAAAEL